MKKLLTIFTPTYNRANTLERLYLNLVSQSYQCFKWVIINDGSRDETDLIVQKFISDNKISIEYIKQENKGKQAAWNRSLDSISTELFCCVDSDDRLFDENVLKNVIEKY